MLGCEICIHNNERMLYAYLTTIKKENCLVLRIDLLLLLFCGLLVLFEDPSVESHLEEEIKVDAIHYCGTTEQQAWPITRAVVSKDIPLVKVVRVDDDTNYHLSGLCNGQVRSPPDLDSSLSHGIVVVEEGVDDCIHNGEQK